MPKREDGDLCPCHGKPEMAVDGDLTNQYTTMLGTCFKENNACNSLSLMAAMATILVANLGTKGVDPHHFLDYVIETLYRAIENGHIQSEIIKPKRPH